MKTFVTPEMAQEWLSKNPQNRHLSQDRAKELATDMLGGRWNGENRHGIMLDKDGNLIDGQHRLTAICIASNEDPKFKGTTLFVYKDVPGDVRSVIDFNRPRSIRDVIHMVDDKANGDIAGSAATTILNWLDTASPRLNARRSKPERIAFIREHEDLLYYSGLAASARGATRPSALAAVIFLATRSGDALTDHAQRFVDGVANGAELPLQDARLSLRGWYYNNRKLSMIHGFSAVAQAWNAFVAQRPMAQISVRVGGDGQVIVPHIIGAPARGSGKMTAEVPGTVKGLIAEARANWTKSSARDEEAASPAS
jgi:hypothetical protein